jgi:hypothetical protein
VVEGEAREKEFGRAGRGLDAEGGLETLPYFLPREMRLAKRR